MSEGLLRHDAQPTSVKAARRLRGTQTMRDHIVRLLIWCGPMTHFEIIDRMVEQGLAARDDNKTILARCRELCSGDNPRVGEMPYKRNNAKGNPCIVWGVFGVHEGVVKSHATEESCRIIAAAARAYCANAIPFSHLEATVKEYTR